MHKEHIDQRAMDIVAAVRNCFDTEIARDASSAEQLGRAIELMAELKPDSNPGEPSSLPVCRHLERALDIGESGPTAAVASAIRDIAPTLVWAQNPRYNADNKGPDFMENYGWSGLGLIGSDAMSFGILMLGPGITYPPTGYPSEGVFLVIAGSPEWKSGDDTWMRVDDGSVIRRPPNGAEGKRAGSEPMLALYSWMYPDK